MTDIKLQILKASYWEHFKAAKDLAMIYPLGHSKRVSIEETINDIQKQIAEYEKN